MTCEIFYIYFKFQEKLKETVKYRILYEEYTNKKAFL